MIFKRTYLDKLLVIVFCSYSISSISQINGTFSSFRYYPVYLKLENGKAELHYSLNKTFGNYKLKEFELHFEDTILNSQKLHLEKKFSCDSVLTDKIKINFIKPFFINANLIITMIYYKNGYLFYRLLNDEDNIINRDIDSFYFKFYGIEAITEMYIVDSTYQNVITFTIPENFENAISLGNTISYLLMDGDKINFRFYNKGELIRINLYRSRRALYKDKKVVLRDFKKSGVWMD